MEKIRLLVQQCKDADLLVLPELCSSGYNFESLEQAVDLAEEIDHSILVQSLIELCNQHGFYIVAGLNEREKDSLYNTSVLVGPQGYIGKYRKTHLFTNEWDYFKPGDLGFPVFDIGICKVGMLICFDWIFPETWRIIALQGADLICHPSNLVLPGFCQRAIPVHALMNRVYIITTNRTGTERNLTFTGMSTIANPKGDVLLQATSTDEETGIVEIDVNMARDKMMTPRNHIFNDRRPDIYSMITKNNISQ